MPTALHLTNGEILTVADMPDDAATRLWSSSSKRTPGDVPFDASKDGYVSFNTENGPVLVSPDAVMYVDEPPAIDPEAYRIRSI